MGRYLGSGDAFNFVIDKVQKKLSGWKAKFLAKAEKMVLAKSTAIPMAEYYMQCQALPIKVCEAIDKLIRDFLWGLTAESRRMHMVNWNTITLPKDRGGLGLYQMQYRNQAILAKLCWRLANESEAPRAKMLAKKYLTTKRLSEEGRNISCSRIWTACKKGGPVYDKV